VKYEGDRFENEDERENNKDQDNSKINNYNSDKELDENEIAEILDQPNDFYVKCTCKEHNSNNQHNTKL
jgi:hypothetical protein